MCVSEQISDGRSVSDNTQSPNYQSRAGTCVSAAGQSSLLNLLDTKGKRSCFQPLLSLARVERSVNPFGAGTPVPPSVRGSSPSCVWAQHK